LRKTLRTLVAATLLALPLTITSATPAAACDRYPCHGACHLNPPSVHIDPNGSYIDQQGNLMECYY